MKMKKHVVALAAAATAMAAAPAFAECMTVNIVENTSSEPVTAYLKIYNANDRSYVIALKETEKAFAAGQTGDIQACSNAMKRGTTYQWRILTRVFTTEQMDLMSPSWKRSGRTRVPASGRCKIFDYGDKRGVFHCW